MTGTADGDDDAAPPTFEAFMVSCRERLAVREATLRRLAEGGWDAPTSVVLDDETGATPLERIHRTWRRALRQAAASGARFALLLEDDLIVGRFFKQNLISWPLLRRLPPEQAFFASLYHAPVAYHLVRPDESYLVARPHSAWGSQALVMPPSLARFIDERWDSEEGNPDMKMPRLAARVTPVYMHLPSLVDHADVPTTWGGVSHRARDFDMGWRRGDAVPGADRPPAGAR